MGHANLAPVSSTAEILEMPLWQNSEPPMSLSPVKSDWIRDGDLRMGKPCSLLTHSCTGTCWFVYSKYRVYEAEGHDAACGHAGDDE